MKKLTLNAATVCGTIAATCAVLTIVMGPGVIAYKLGMVNEWEAYTDGGLHYSEVAARLTWVIITGVVFGALAGGLLLLSARRL